MPLTTDAVETFLTATRLGGLVLSPDGSRLLVGVDTLTPDGKGRRTALWELDPAGRRDARQVTRSREGEGAAALTRDGTLLFGAKRPHPDADDGDPGPTLWALPRDGGEAYPVCSPDAGVAGVLAARDADQVVVVTSLHPGADTLGADRGRQRQRTEAGVSAQLFDTYPTARWDHYLGPREPAVLTVDGLAPPTVPSGALATPDTDAAEDDADAQRPGDDAVRVVARGPELGEGDLDLSPDGTTVVASVGRHHRLHRSGPSDLIRDLVVIDVASGRRRTLVADDVRWFGDVRISPTARGWPRWRPTPGTPTAPRPRRWWWSTWPPATSRSSPPGGTCGPRSRGGCPTVTRCCSAPTRAGTDRCSASTSPPTR